MKQNLADQTGEICYLEQLQSCSDVARWSLRVEQNWTEATESDCAVFYVPSNTV